MQMQGLPQPWLSGKTSRIAGRKAALKAKRKKKKEKKGQAIGVQ